MWIYLFATVLGLIVGSFLNVVIHRLPRGTSVVLPRSRCPYCGGIVRARDNLPLLSFVLLRGRCRNCGAPISWRYPLVEGATALAFLACLYRFGATAEALSGAFFCSLLLVLAAIDIDYFLLPDKITLPGIVAGLALQPWLPRTTFFDAVGGALIGAGVLVLTINYWYWLREEEGMGMGDVNMLAMVGAFVGWRGVIVALVISAFAGAATGLGLMVFGKLDLRSRLPFGAFLALGAVAALFFGERLARAYQALLL